MIVFLVSFITKHDPYKHVPIVWSVWFHGPIGLKPNQSTEIGKKNWVQLGSKKEEENK